MIENYIGKLDKNKVDAWKAVSNRFKSISINNDESEIYDMVATVLNRDKKLFEKYIEQHSEQFDALKKVIERDHSFTALNDENVEDFALRCYPLHPYTLLLLPKISELVAQNERTIFTFLSSTERYSVPYFLRTDNSNFPIIEPDYIYDYFEKLFKGEPYGSNVKKQWQITTAALSKLKEYDNPLAEKIVKTIALIYCVNDFEIIPPSWDIICEIYSVNYRWGDIEAAKETLKKAHLLIELLYKPYVRITEGSGHDVLGLIQQEAYKIENITKAKDVFNDVCEIKYLYPVQYNDENEVIRYFDFRFIDCSELQNIQPEGFVLDTKADGVVFAVLVRTPSELESAISHITSNHNKRAVFILPKDCSDSDSIAINYQAILNLKKQYEGKEIELVEELNYISLPLLITPFLTKVSSRLDEMDIADKGIKGIEATAIRELLARGECLCGTDLKPGTLAYKNVEKYIDYIPPKAVGTLVREMQDCITANDENAKNFISDFEELYKRIQKNKCKIAALETEDKEVLAEISAIGKVSTVDAEENLSRYKRMISELREELSKKISEKTRRESERETAENNFNMYRSKSEKAKEYQLYYKYAQAMYYWVNKQYSEKEAQMRDRLNKYVTELFDNIYSGNRDIYIDDKYNINITVNGEIVDDTGGLRVIQYFAYVGGLVKLAYEVMQERTDEEGNAQELGEQYPLVLDAAFSHADQTHTQNIARELANATSQLIFAVMEKDWLYAKTGLTGKVSRIYELNKIDETEVQIVEVK